MFKSEKTNDFRDAETVIGPSVKVEGDFSGQGNLIVDGVIKGNVSTNGNLKVGDKAKITASVSAANALISGEVRGNIIIQEDLELTATAKVFGDVQTKSICIARGAILSGKCTMDQKNLKAENGKKGKGGVEESLGENKLADEAEDNFD